MEGMVHLYYAGVFWGPQNDAIFEGSGFLQNMIYTFKIDSWKAILFFWARFFRQMRVPIGL